MSILVDRDVYGGMGATGGYATYGVPSALANVNGEVRPTTFHPSQAPPLARAPLCEFFPSLPQDQVIAMSRLPLGYAPAADAKPNNVNGFGRVVIRHEPLHGPILPGRYVVVVTGLSPGSYSVTVSAAVAYPAHMVIEGAIRTASAAAPRMHSARTDLDDIVLCQRLGVRKRQLVGHLVGDSDATMQTIQEQHDRLTTALAQGVLLLGDLASDDDEDAARGATMLTKDKERMLKEALEMNVNAEDLDDLARFKKEKDDAEAANLAANDEKKNKVALSSVLSKAKAKSSNTEDERLEIEGAEKAVGRATKAAAAIAASIALKISRAREVVSVSESVRARIAARLTRLDKRLLDNARSLHTRRREYSDISDGLAALANARARRESDLAGLLLQAREYSRHMPQVIIALQIIAPPMLLGVKPELDSAKPFTIRQLLDNRDQKRSKKKSLLRRDSVFASVGLANINETLSLSTNPTDSGGMSMDDLGALSASGNVLGGGTMAVVGGNLGKGGKARGSSVAGRSVMGGDGRSVGGDRRSVGGGSAFTMKALSQGLGSQMRIVAGIVIPAGGKLLSIAARSALKARDNSIALEAARLQRALGLAESETVLKLTDSAAKGSDRDTTGIDGQPGGVEEGLALSITRGTVHHKTIEFRYYYPEADEEEALYVRIGPWPLLWNKHWAQEQFGDAEPTPASRVRRKRFSDLTAEEKTWMSMDRLLHPEAYESGAGSAISRLVEAGMDGAEEGEQDSATELLARAAILEQKARDEAIAARIEKDRLVAEENAHATLAALERKAARLEYTKIAGHDFDHVATATSSTSDKASKYGTGPPNRVFASDSDDSVATAIRSAARAAGMFSDGAGGTQVVAGGSGGGGGDGGGGSGSGLGGGAVGGESVFVSGGSGPSEMGQAVGGRIAPPPLNGYGLVAPASAILSTLYMSVEDKEGCRGGQRDIGTVATALALEQAGLAFGVTAAAMTAIGSKAGAFSDDGILLNIPEVVPVGAAGSRTVPDPLDRSRRLDASAPAVDDAGVKSATGWSRMRTGQALVPAASTAVRLYASKLDSLLPKCLYTRQELTRFTTCAFEALTRQEQVARRLLMRFHDNPGPAKIRAHNAKQQQVMSDDVKEAVAMRGAVDGVANEEVLKQQVSNAADFTGFGSGWGGAKSVAFFSAELKYDAKAKIFVYNVDYSKTAEVHRRRQRTFTVQGDFQAGDAPPMSAARSAVPVPKGAPIRLARLLQERSRRLQALWHARAEGLITEGDPPPPPGYEGPHPLGLSKPPGPRRKRPAPGATGDVILHSGDPDDRARQLLLELDRANASTSSSLDSSIIAGFPQRFTTSILRDSLEIELDRLLLSMIFEREAIERALLNDAEDARAEAAADAAQEALERLRLGRQVAEIAATAEAARRRVAARSEASQAGKLVLLTLVERAVRARRMNEAQVLLDANAEYEHVGRLEQHEFLGDHVLPDGEDVTKHPGWSAVDSKAAKLAKLLEDEHANLDAAGRETIVKLQASLSRAGVKCGGDYEYSKDDPIHEHGGLALWGHADAPQSPHREKSLLAAVNNARFLERNNNRSRHGGSSTIDTRLAILSKKRRALRFAENGGRSGGVLGLDGSLNFPNPMSAAVAAVAQSRNLNSALSLRLGAADVSAMINLSNTDNVAVFVPPTPEESVRLSLRGGNPHVPPNLPGFCWACRCQPCIWIAYCNINLIVDRLAIIDAELERLKKVPDIMDVTMSFSQGTSGQAPWIRSDKALSFLRGGLLRVLKPHAVFELRSERMSLRGTIRLAELDAELHSVFKERTAAVTCTALNQGIATQLWRSNAIVLLSAESNRVLARLVTIEILDDIIDNMCEAWIFGEISASKSVIAGIVPSFLSGSVGHKAPEASEHRAAALRLAAADVLRPLRSYEGRSAAARLFASQGSATRARALDAARGLLPVTAGTRLAANLDAAAGLARLGLVTYSLAGAPVALPGANKGLTAGNRAMNALGGAVVSYGPVDLEIGSANGSAIPAGYYSINAATEAGASQARAGTRQLNALHGVLDSSLDEASNKQAMVSLEQARAAYAAAAAIAVTSAATAARVDPAFLAAASNQQAMLAVASGTMRVGGLSIAHAAGPSTGDPIEDARRLVIIASDSLSGLRQGVLDTTYAGAMLALPPQALGAGVRTTQEQRTAGISYEVAARAAIRNAVLTAARVVDAMEVAETTLTYGMFLLALAYFRIMNQLAKLKHMFTTDGQRSGEEIFGMNKPPRPDVGVTDGAAAAATAERLRMDRAARERLKRESAKAAAFAAAFAGRSAVIARRVAYHDAQRAMQVARLTREQKRHVAAKVVQASFRTYRVKKTMAAVKDFRTLNNEFEALRNYAASRVQASWRGYMSRCVVDNMRSELSVYLKHARLRDVLETADKFYEANPLLAVVEKVRSSKAEAGGLIARAKQRAKKLAKDTSHGGAKKLVAGAADGNGDNARAAAASQHSSRERTISQSKAAVVVKPEDPQVVRTSMAAKTEAAALARHLLRSQVIDISVDPYAAAGSASHKAMLDADADAAGPRPLDFEALGNNDAFFRRRTATEKEVASKALGSSLRNSSTNPLLVFGEDELGSGMEIDSTVRFADTSGGRLRVVLAGRELLSHSGKGPDYLRPLPRTTVTIPSVAEERGVADDARLLFFSGTVGTLEEATSIVRERRRIQFSTSVTDVDSGVPVTALAFNDQIIGRRTTKGELDLTRFSERRTTLQAMEDAKFELQRAAAIKVAFAQQAADAEEMAIRGLTPAQFQASKKKKSIEALMLAKIAK